MRGLFSLIEPFPAICRLLVIKVARAASKDPRTGKALGAETGLVDGQIQNTKGRCSLPRGVSCRCRCLLHVTHCGSVIAVSFEEYAEFLVLFGNSILSLSARPHQRRRTSKYLSNLRKEKKGDDSTENAQRT